MKILILDLETAPLMGFVWKLFKTNIGLNQIVSDSYMLSYAAKWHDDDRIFYKDQRHKANYEDDKSLVISLKKLIDEADMVVGHNVKNFDLRVFNGRCLEHGIPPTSSYRAIDTMLIAKKHFKLPSYKLEYLTNKYNTTYKKLKHEEFPGFDLWREVVLNRNKKAWQVMDKYNRHDVLATEELYFNTLFTWDNDTNYFNYQADQNLCRCGSNDWVRNGIHRTPQSQFQRYKCKPCGYEWRSTKSLNRSRFVSTQRG